MARPPSTSLPADVLAAMEASASTRAQTALPRLRVASPAHPLTSQSSDIALMVEPVTLPHKPLLPHSVAGIIASPIAARSTEGRMSVPSITQVAALSSGVSASASSAKAPPNGALPPRISPRTSKLQLQAAGASVLSNSSGPTPRGSVTGTNFTVSIGSVGGSAAGPAGIGARGRRIKK